MPHDRAGTIKNPIVGLDASDTAASSSAAIAAGSLKGLMSTSDKFPFQRGVVVEVINDVYKFSELLEEDEKYFTLVANEAVAGQATRNSLLIAPYDDQLSGKLLVCLPFFPSHIVLPIKVGEVVWWIEGPSYPYWFSRVASTDQIEDVNYTHLDQELITSVPLPEDAKTKVEKQEGSTGRFQPEKNNGIGGSFGGLSFVPLKYAPENLENQGMYSNIPEAIPRFTPKVGDLVLQGSNNTLISLGTDRGWTKEDEGADIFDISNASDDVLPGSGTIDIVVGRGMLEDDPKPASESSAGDDPERTKPRTVTTKEGSTITDKTFVHNDDEPNRTEGDPDFHADLSRVYVTMNSSVDQKLSITKEYNDPISGSFDDVEGASVAIKSNEIRIVSRSDGSVRILKEKGEGQGSSIVMMQDGTIHISGDKVYIGQPGGKGEGENGSEAYVLHSQLKDWCNKLHSELDAFCTTVAGHTTPGYGVPSPQITQAAVTMKANLLGTVKPVINNFPSKRIYGE